MAQVMTDTWERRRVRTEVLRGRYPFAAEMLDLNAALLPVQEAAFLDAITAPPEPQRISAYVADQVVPGVIEVTMASGPERLQAAVAAEDLASGGRRLVRARCHGDWGYPRMTCTSCGEQSGSRLPVYSEVGTAAGERGGVVRGLGIPAETDALFPHTRIEACETCGRYLLNIDLAGDGQAVPLVDELSALPLDLYARDLGFTKITPNLMGF